MDWLEEELKQALARKEPSADFASRVGKATRRRSNLVIMNRRWIAAAALVVAVIGAGEGYEQYRGRAAKAQVMLAMRIAGGKLNRVQELTRGRQ
jgi:hypothetical protein